MLDNLKATLPRVTTLQGRNFGGEKEMVRALSVVALRKGSLYEPVKVRWWMARKADGAGRVHCSIWTDGKVYAAGYGYAGGYGYDKESAALESAVNGAGIALSAEIGGVGDQAIRAAVIAIARAQGYRGKLTIVSH